MQYSLFHFFFTALEGAVQYRNMSRAFEIARTLQCIAPSCVWFKVAQRGCLPSSSETYGRESAPDTQSDRTQLEEIE